MKDLSKISLLIDFYGKLLTEKQYEYLNDYYFNDLSLNEIAENNKVSKNAIYDSIKKATMELEKYENTLNLIENHLKRVELYQKISDKNLKEELLKTEMVNYGK